DVGVLLDAHRDRFWLAPRGTPRARDHRRGDRRSHPRGHRRPRDPLAHLTLRKDGRRRRAVRTRHRLARLGGRGEPGSVTETLHRNAVRMRETLRELGMSGEVHQLADSARTAREAAEALEVPVGAICSSLVFLLDGEPLGAALGGTITRADADAVRAATGQPIGGVAPVGHPAPVRTVIDVALEEFEVVWAAAGHPHAVFPTTFAELLRVTAGDPRVVGP